MMTFATKSPQRRRQGTGVAQPGATGAPEGYTELRRYLPERPQRRFALGVTENTILAWDEQRASRINRKHQGRVAVLVWTCANLRPYLSSESDVGEFLVRKQLVLGNRQPCGLIRVHGESGALAVVKLVKAAARRAADDRAKLELEAIIGNEPLWKAMSDGLSDVALERLDSYKEAARGLGASNGSRDMLR